MASETEKAFPCLDTTAHQRPLRQAVEGTDAHGFLRRAVNTVDIPESVRLATRLRSGMAWLRDNERHEQWDAELARWRGMEAGWRSEHGISGCLWGNGQTCPVWGPAKCGAHGDTKER